MLEFDWKIRNGSEYWNLRTKLGINQNVEIWVLIVKSIKMSILEWKVGNQSKSWRLSSIRWELIKMLKFECKCQVDQNVEIWVKRGSRLIKMSNLSERGELKCWNLSEKAIINQNVEIWVQMWESIKMLKFERERGDWSNVDILLRKWKSIKMFKFDWK